MLVLNRMLTHFDEMWTYFRVPEAYCARLWTRWTKGNCQETNESLHYSFQVLHLISTSIKVFLCGTLKAYTSLSPQYFLSLHFSSTYAGTLTVTAGNRTLPQFGWQPRGFSWQGPASVTGLAPVTGLFKFVFGVTEIPTTCTPPYFSYALVLASSGKKNALCGLAH